MNTIVTIGIDLAKNVFAIHGVDATGQPALVRPNVPRAKLRELIARLPLDAIGSLMVLYPEPCFANAKHSAKRGCHSRGLG
jgi:hypothetical protein